ncbi:YcaO-like family protein [Paenibacillus sp. DYY-L-2]|uniref:YcaO-like family protein n=1 Tax=Paenibacillus sp. DYY-L-2 TaxID=3447013 RepID=UPI003F501BF3
MSRALIRRSDAGSAAGRSTVGADAACRGLTATLPENLRKAISPHGGIVRGLMNLSSDPGDPRLFLSLAAPGNPKFFGREQHGLIDFFASGMGFTPEEANVSAVAEAVERYCAAYVTPERTVLASWKEIEGEALHPDELPLFTKEQYEQWQFPYRPFTEQSRIRWVQSRSLSTGRSKWVPAAIAWDSYIPQSNDEEAICFGLMTGSAAGSTKEQAMISGLLEIIERDAFMIMWYNSLSLPRLDVREFAVAGPFKELLDPSRFQLEVVDTTSDIGIPSAFGLLTTRDGKVSVGGSARLSMKDAVRKTLMEISQLFIGNKGQIYSKALPSLLPHQVTDYGLRLPYYEQPFANEELAFTIASGDIRPIPGDTEIVRGSEAERLQHIVDCLKKRGLEVLCVDVTTDDVRQLGLHVVKMIVPGTVQLPRSEKERLITSDRIYRTPMELGLRSGPIKPEDLNNSPHPFP